MPLTAIDMENKVAYFIFSIGVPLTTFSIKSGAKVKFLAIETKLDLQL
jgi:hypothetical protein